MWGAPAALLTTAVLNGGDNVVPNTSRTTPKLGTRNSDLEKDTATIQVAAIAAVLAEQLTRWDLEGGREFAKRRDLGVAFSRLDPADLGRVDTAAFGHLLLGQIQLLAGSTQVGSQVAHATDRRPSGHQPP